MRYSNSLEIKIKQETKVLCCRKCDTTISRADESWKSKAVLVEKPMNELEGPYTTGKTVLLRSFGCPKCGALLDTELANEGDGFLDDRLL